MIFHPGVIGLLLGSSITLIMLLYAAVTAIIIIRRWDFSSSSALQLQLERKTYLISTIVQFGLIIQIATLFLFIFTADEIHQLFVGAMCATGSLNANPIGWWALLSKIATFYLAGFWVALNRLDQSSEDYPLVRTKYLLLIGLLPFFLLDWFLQVGYFTGLDPDIITSCCGSLFSDGDEITLASLATLKSLSAMILFMASTLTVLTGSILALVRHTPFTIFFSGMSAAIFFPVAIIAIISFISPYVYELPTHNCPFDILQREYSFIGYPIYMSLFFGVYFCCLPALFSPFRKIKGLNDILHQREIIWMRWGLGAVISFLTLVTWAIYSSSLNYFI